MPTINLGRVKGDKGDAASISLGTVSTGAAGTNASVTNTGTPGAAVFNFAIPRGDKGETGSTGPANTLTIAGVTTGAPGSSASVSVGGTAPNQTLTFSIPRGDTGATGEKGDAGNAATISLGTVTTGAAGSSVSITNTGTSSAAVYNFTIPRGDKGEKGDTGNTGPANSLTVDSVTTGAAGSSASVVLGGTAPNQTISFTIPRGEKGEVGNTGPIGETGPAGPEPSLNVVDNSATAITLSDANNNRIVRCTASTRSGTRVGGYRYDNHLPVHDHPSWCWPRHIRRWIGRDAQLLRQPSLDRWPARPRLAYPRWKWSIQPFGQPRMMILQQTRGNLSSGLDGDARAYINAVRATGATVSNSQAFELSRFIKKQKGENLWNSIFRLYLPIWGRVSANAICLKTLTSGTFQGSITHASGYVQGDGATFTFFSLNSTASSLGITSQQGCLFALISTVPSNSFAGLIGVREGNNDRQTGIMHNTGGNGQIAGISASSTTSVTNVGNVGIHLISRTTSTRQRMFVRRASGLLQGGISTAQSDSTLSTKTIWAMSLNGEGTFPSSSRFGLYGAMAGINDDQASNFTLDLKTLWETCTGLTLP